ncbi:MAG: hypothetical protein LBP59_18180 [Planctomycetaceae bacterium]|jgi:hypothetical protein|nr:hypothetical protein [Planctomycetaceae bacterium]
MRRFVCLLLGVSLLIFSGCNSESTTVTPPVKNVTGDGGVKNVKTPEPNVDNATKLDDNKVENDNDVLKDVKSDSKPEPELKPEINVQPPELKVDPDPKPEVKPEPKPAPKPEVKTEPKPESKPEVKPEPKPEPKPEVKPEPKPEPKPEVKPEPKPVPKPEVKPEPKPAPKPEVKPEPKPAPKPEVKPEPKPEPKPEIKPEPKPESKPEIKPEPKPESKPEIKPETKPESKPEIKPEPKPESKPEVKTEPKAESKPVTPESKVAKDATVKNPLPVLTLRIASIDHLLGIAKRIVGVVDVDSATFDAVVEMGLGSVEGLNRSEQIGLIFRTNGVDFNDPLFILPINDLSKFSIPAFQFLQIEKIEDNKFSVKLPNFNLIAYQKKGYVVVAPEVSKAPIPENPLSYLSDLNKYVLGVKFDLENTSYDAVSKLLAPFIMLTAMQNPEAGEQIQQSVEMMKVYFDELKTVTYGISIDAKTLDTELAISMTALEKATAFNFTKALKDRKTVFSGLKTSQKSVFKIAQAAKIEKIPDEIKNATNGQFEALFDGFLKQIEEDAENDDEIKYAKDAINSIKKLLAASLNLKVVDYAVSFDVEGTFGAATAFGETAEVEKLFDSVIGFIRAKHEEEKDRKDFDVLVKENLKRNYETISGYKISSLTIPFSAIAENHKKEVLPKLKGKSYTFLIAVKDGEAIVVAGGFETGKTQEYLKTILTTTKNPTPILQPIAAFDFQALGLFLKEIGFEDIDKNESSQTAKFLIDQLTEAGNNAKITVTDKLEGTTYYTSTKLDGKVIDIFAKFAKRCKEEIDKLQVIESEETKSEDDDK